MILDTQPAAERLPDLERELWASITCHVLRNIIPADLASDEGIHIGCS
jgi:hypothetical protein